MKLYFAAAANKTENEAIIEAGAKNMLYSYYYFNTNSLLPFLQGVMELKGMNIFIDSGAFSAHVKGIEIKVDDYCKFIQNLNPSLYATLDVIGDAAATEKNTKYMESGYGFSPMPVFHMGETLDDLKHLFAYDYIALGGMVNSPQLESWLDSVWWFIWKYKPTLKVHGFGMTDLGLMIKYPWYSVDSSGIFACTRFASIAQWNSGRNTMFNIEAPTYLRSMGYTDFKKGDSLGKYRGVIIKESFDAYIKMEAYINKCHAKKDWDYLTAQQKMFE